MRKCKWDDDTCECNEGGYCTDEDYGVDGICPFEEGGQDG